MSKINKQILVITRSGMLIALVFVATAFLRIPYPGNEGYFNFGDAVIFVASMFVSPIEAILIAGVGAALGDLYAGGLQFVPFTLVAKMAMAILTWLFYHKICKNNKIFRYSGIFIGAIFMVACYLVSYLVLFDTGMPGSLFYSLFDLIQGFGCGAIAIGLAIPISKYLSVDKKIED